MGNLEKSEEKVENQFYYAGEQRDSITKQYYLRARYYNPVIGRFTQEDTYHGDGLNLYSYCGNNPIMYVDSSGNICEAAAERIRAKVEAEQATRNKQKKLAAYGRHKERLDRELNSNGNDKLKKEKSYSMDYIDRKREILQEGGRKANTRDMKRFAREMNAIGVPVIFDTKNKILPYDKAGSFDSYNNRVAIRKKHHYLVLCMKVIILNNTICLAKKNILPILLYKEKDMYIIKLCRIHIFLQILN